MVAARHGDLEGHERTEPLAAFLRDVGRLYAIGGRREGFRDLVALADEAVAALAADGRT